MNNIKLISDKALSSYNKSTIATAIKEFDQCKHQCGALAIEYVLIIAILATIAIVTANAMSHELQAFFEVAAEKVNAWTS